MIFFPCHQAGKHWVFLASSEMNLTVKGKPHTNGVKVCRDFRLPNQIVLQLPG